MNNRQSKIQILQEVFNSGNIKAIKENDVIEMERLLKVNPNTLSNEDLEKCLEYLSIQEGKPYEPLNLSTWTNEQLETRLFELNNKDHETN